MILQYIDSEDTLNTDAFAEVSVVRIDKQVATSANSIIRRIQAGGKSRAIGDEFSNHDLEMACQPEFEWIANRGIDSMAFTGIGTLFDTVFFVFEKKEEPPCSRRSSPRDRRRTRPS